MAQVKFWRGSYERYKQLTKDNSSVYFVTDINEELTNPAVKIANAYNAVIIGEKIIASSQTTDFDLSALEAIIGDLALLEGDLSGKNVVESLNYLQQSIKDIVVAPGGDIEEVKALVEKLQQDIDSLSLLVGDGVFTSDITSGKNVTEAINAITTVLGNTVEGSIGDLGDIHEDIKADNIVGVINKLDAKTHFVSANTPDDYEMPSSFNRLTYKDVRSKSAEEILEMMLFPDTLPEVISSPSATLVVPNYKPIMEVGSVISGELSSVYTQGEIGVKDMPNTVKKYSGSATAYDFTGSGIVASRVVTNVKPINTIINDGDNTWTVVVSYGDGETPVSAKGNPQEQLKGLASNVQASATIVGVYPVYTNKDIVTSLNSKEPLVKDTVKTFDVNYIQANDSDDRYKIAVKKGGPRGAISKIELFNDLSNSFSVQSLGLFNKLEDVTMNVQGSEIVYEVWGCTATSFGTNSRFRFTFE